MKLTSKWLTAAAMAGLCVSVANADTLVYDTFETDQTWVSWYDYWASQTQQSAAVPLVATNGMPATEFRRGYYEATTESYQQPWTNNGDDASYITNVNPVVTWASATDAETVPGTNSAAGAATSAQYLVLDTQGETLTRTFTQTDLLTEGSVYVDTMIQFTASDGEPSGLSDSGAHIALWLDNTTSNLMLFCAAIDLNTGDSNWTNYVVATEISTEKWYRLTIQSRGADGVTIFRVALDGSWLSTEDAFAEADLDMGTGTDKQWFASAQSCDAAGTQTTPSSTLSAIDFQGSGAVDNLTVSTDTPDFDVTSSAVLLTLSWDSTIASVTTNGTALASGDTIASGTEVVITAADWYALTDTNITGVTVDSYTAGGSTYGTASTVLTATLSANAVATATITATPYAAGTVDGADAAKAATWAIANSVTLANFADYYSKYLLNADATATVDFAITSIETGYTVTTIKVLATANGTTGLDPAAFNGTLKYQAAASLAGLATAEKTAVTFSATDVDATTKEVTIEVPVSAGSFIKAWVE